jgi:hypothetical protein
LCLLGGTSGDESTEQMEGAMAIEGSVHDLPEPVAVQERLRLLDGRDGIPRSGHDRRGDSRTR